jgi:hypothetical protein
MTHKIVRHARGRWKRRSCSWLRHGQHWSISAARICKCGMNRKGNVRAGGFRGRVVEHAVPWRGHHKLSPAFSSCNRTLTWIAAEYIRIPLADDGLIPIPTFQTTSSDNTTESLANDYLMSHWKSLIPPCTDYPSDCVDRFQHCG